VKVPHRSALSWQTPLYQQYWKLKDEVPQTLLFFRLGDFFELFGEDAVQAAPLLEVQLTSRDRSEEGIPMCGIPFHAWESYAEKILNRGLKIAIADQVEEASATKKLVERQITRILTPGLPIDPQRIEAKEDHYLCAISPIGRNLKKDSSLELCFLDFLGRRVFSGEVTGVAALAELLKMTHPREIIYSSDLDILSSEYIYLEKEFSQKLSVWKSGSALSVLSDYLAYTQRWSLKQVEEFLPSQEPLAQFLGSSFEAKISSQVLEQWDVLPHLGEFLDACGSAAGSRELKRLLAHPLAHAGHIQARQDFVKELPVGEILSLTKNIYDLERLVGRISIRAAKAVELLRVRDSLRVLKSLDEVFSRPWSQKLKKLSELEGFSLWEDCREVILGLEKKFSATLCDAPTAAPDCRDLICEGIDSRFDELKNLYKNLEQWLQNFEEKLRKETSISNLKVRFNRVNGFYIEVSKSHLSKIPSHFERRQTLVNAERFTHPELKQREEEILGAEDKLERKAKEIIENLSDQLRAESLGLLKALRLVAYVDAFAGAERSVQKYSAHGPWVCPAITEGRFYFSIEEGRHPLIEARERSFVSNSLTLGMSKKRLLLLTGPNMAGKSTLMRQCGIILLLAQIGLRVPAEKVEMSPARGFFSRMGASDRILMGESTFMVEMREMAGILRDADEDSFVLIDEIGRGTSTRDGLALAKSFLEFFANERPSLTLFATHYHELAPFSQPFESVVNGSMSIREWKGDLVFLRKLIYESASSSYGLHVAKLAGISSKLLNRAKNFYDFKSENSSEKPSLSLSLFDQPIVAKANKDSVLHEEELSRKIKKQDEWSDKIAALDTESLSPRDAWKLLDEWRNSAAQEGPDA
jgi:DNA mismatch repair protein MutS